MARNLSGSCSTTARSQSSLQRSLVSPRKVSPPKWHLFAVHDFTIITNRCQQAAPPACSINSENQDSKKQLGRQIITGREVVPPQLLGCDLFEVLRGEAQVKFAAPPCRFPAGHLGCQNAVAQYCQPGFGYRIHCISFLCSPDPEYRKVPYLLRSCPQRSPDGYLGMSASTHSSQGTQEKINIPNGRRPAGQAAHLGSL